MRERFPIFLGYLALLNINLEFRIRIKFKEKSWEIRGVVILLSRCTSVLLQMLLKKGCMCYICHLRDPRAYYRRNVNIFIQVFYSPEIRVWALQREGEGGRLNKNFIITFFYVSHTSSGSVRYTMDLIFESAMHILTCEILVIIYKFYFFPSYFTEMLRSDFRTK